MHVVNGTCIDCGCASHECECTDGLIDGLGLGNKMEAYLDHIENRADAHRCFDCHNFGCSYMVVNGVWNEAWPNCRLHKRILMTMARERFIEHKPACELCLDCLQLRLERKLKIGDFSDVPINKGIFLGFELGAASTRG